MWQSICKFLVLVSFALGTVAADEPKSRPDTQSKKLSAVVPNSPQPSDGDDEADASTLSFVRLHQPELANLLQYLKSKRSSDYRDALKEIRRVRERLENLKKKDQELHDVELALWQNSAQLRLWAASISVSSKRLSEADRSKLTQLVTRENELMTRRLTLEKARTEARLEQLNQQLSKRVDQSESIIAKGIKTWESRIERPAGKNKNKTPATETKNTLDRS